MQKQQIHYWRTKQGKEIDFIVKNRAGNILTAIECKFSCSSDDGLAHNVGKNFEAFRALYPTGENLVVAHNVDRSFTRKHNDLTITFVSAQELVKKLKLIA
ncbi:MAG: DUF4143 domain-containing protein [Candidatus Dependentiae bacterium]|nr:DUF4143 domain-containing protein [Candidatus Dependentiae bacterium]